MAVVVRELGAAVWVVDVRARIDGCFWRGAAIGKEDLSSALDCWSFGLPAAGLGPTRASELHCGGPCPADTKSDPCAFTWDSSMPGEPGSWQTLSYRWLLSSKYFRGAAQLTTAHFWWGSRLKLPGRHRNTSSAPLPTDTPVVTDDTTATMLLDTRAMRHLTADDWRVLAAVRTPLSPPRPPLTSTPS